LFQLL